MLVKSGIINDNSTNNSKSEVLNELGASWFFIKPITLFKPIKKIVLYFYRYKTIAYIAFCNSLIKIGYYV